MSSTVLSSYNVKAGSFEGPLELLLSLIEERKFFVNEISLAEVTTDYISFLKSLNESGNEEGERHLADVSYFVLVASTLILIKSKSLLPNLSLTEDEKENISDLENRLRIYKIIKDASFDVNKVFGKKIIFMPTERIWTDPIFSPDKNISTPNISNLIQGVISNAPKKVEPLPDIEVKKIISLNDVINNLTERIQGAINLSFREFTKDNNSGEESDTKVSVIISFLAMLELVREGVINVIQNTSFGDIEMNQEQEVSGNIN